MSSRFRRPGRKSSTPFFPGAWPSTPVPDTSTDSHVGRAANISIPAQQHANESTASVNISPAHLDHVINFHRRISQSYAALSRARQPSNTSTSMADSPTVQSPPTSPVLSESSAGQSDGIQTPEDYPIGFPQDPSMLSGKAPHPLSQVPIPVPVRPSRNPSRNASLNRATAEVATRLSSVPLDSPLSKPSPGLQHVEIPPHQLSFSPDSVTSYFSSPNNFTVTNDTRSPALRSYSSSTSSIALPRSGRNAFSAVRDYGTDSHSIGGLGTRNSGAASTSSSSGVARTDSPVLPSDDGLSPNGGVRHDTSRYRSPASNPINTSSPDMDAFGLAAANSVITDTDSIMSIPTSFQSTSAQGSMSADNTARGHACRQSSASFSLSLDLSSNALDRSPTKVSNTRVPSPSVSPGKHREAKAHAGTVSGDVVALASQVTPKKGLGKTGKFWSIKKVKQIGTRIKKLFKGKAEYVDASETVYGVANTRTSVEYTSEHPISRKETKQHVTDTPNFPHRSNTSPLFRFSKRRHSMPPGAVSMPDVSQPRPLRPVSFLAMDGRSLQSSRHLLGMPAVARIHKADPRSKDQPKKQQYRHSTIYAGSQNASGPDRNKYPPPVRTRTRTQTAPSPNGSVSRFSRLSLSGALGDAIRTTVIPHPPLPNYAARHGYVHRRSSSTSAGDAWNAARRPDCDLGLSMYPLHSKGFPRPRMDMYETPHPTERRTAEKAETAWSKIVTQTTSPNSPSSPVRRGSNELAAMEYTIPDMSPGSVSGRSRSHTQSTVRPSGVPSTHDKRRSRGFSFSSAISKRALKARSMISGRNPEPPLPALPTQGQAAGLITSISGISFDMITSTDESMHNRRQDTPSGCAEYDPDIVLDRMSFAATPEIPSTGPSSMNLSLSPDGSMSHLPKEVYFTAESSSSIATNDDDTPMQEEEEDREFMRTLGLEFDAIVERARSE